MTSWVGNIGRHLYGVESFICSYDFYWYIFTFICFFQLFFVFPLLTCYVLFQFYQVAVLYMATRLFCNLSQAFIPIYLQDSLKLQEESVAYIPLVIYVSGFLVTTIMRPLNKFIGRKVSVCVVCKKGEGA